MECIILLLENSLRNLVFLRLILDSNYACCPRGSFWNRKIIHRTRRNWYQRSKYSFYSVNVNSNNFIFQIDIWIFFKFFRTALMYASQEGYIDIVQLLLQQEGIDINAKDAFLFYLEFVADFFCFIMIFGIYSSYFKLHFRLHLKMDIMTSLNWYQQKSNRNSGFFYSP